MPTEMSRLATKAAEANDKSHFPSSCPAIQQIAGPLTERLRSVDYRQHMKTLPMPDKDKR